MRISSLAFLSYYKKFLHPDLWQQFHHFIKPVPTSTDGFIDNSHADIDTFMNSTGNFGLSEYNEYPLSQVSKIDDVAMLDLGSQTQLSHKLVNLVTQDVAPAKAKEENAADEGKCPAQENNVVAVAD